jgi:hypothetical protein
MRTIAANAAPHVTADAMVEVIDAPYCGDRSTPQPVWTEQLK